MSRKTRKEGGFVGFLKNKGGKPVLMALSLVVAILLWFSVAVFFDSTMEVTVSDIPVSFGTELGTNSQTGLDIIADESETTVNITVSGPRYKVSRFTKDNFEAIAQTSAVTAAGEYTLNLNVKLAVDDPEIEIVAYKRTVTAKFDKFKTTEYIPEVEAPRISAADGYVLGKPFSTPDKISLRGAEADINKIVKVKVVTAIEQTVKETTTVAGKLEYYDKDGIKLDGESMPSVKPAVAKIDITIPVYKTKILPVTFSYTNVPEGFDDSIMKPVLSETQIEIGGPTDLISTMNELNLGEVDFRKISLGAEFELEVKLPAGFINVKNVTKLKLSFNFDGFATAEHSSEKFVLKNTPADFDVIMVTQKISDITLVGLKEDMEGLSGADITISIDFADKKLSEGTQEFTAVVFVNGKRAWAVGEYTVNIKVTKKS